MEKQFTNTAIKDQEQNIYIQIYNHVFDQSS